MGHDPSDRSLPPAQPFGPFFLDKRIAVGGSAEVFLAHPKYGDRPAPRLVVKRLLPSVRARSDLGLLEREAELHRAVHHPNVVTVFGAGEINGEPYIAMEYVEGVDVYRLLRRAEAEHRPVTPPLAVHIARQVADALGSVHSARDAHGRPLEIVHRDINPSNVYLSVTGAVKVGDFGIARTGTGSPKSVQAGRGLKGKFGYLAPEQVAGEPFDHRADLFALTVLLGEMLIGERIFPGSGELAVLLAIRDGDYERLRERSSALPRALYALCQRGLAQRPEARFQSAVEMSAALSAFELPSPEELCLELAEWVRWAQDDGKFFRKIEGRIRDSVQRMRAARLVTSPPSFSSAVPPPTDAAGPPSETAARVRREGSEVIEVVAFPKLLEMVATGDLGAHDTVALMGSAFRAIEDIEELGRHLLPSNTQTTRQLHEPGVPDYQAMLAETPMNSVLAYLRGGHETGALFVTRREGTVERRKEIYLKDGRLHYVASSDRAELLGEYLVRRGALERARLDEALSIIALHGGRLGDTLIEMNLVEPIDLFRAIRDQGRDRVAALCTWTDGNACFYRGTVPGRVEFPLDLDLTSPMMAGVVVISQGDLWSLLPNPDAPMEEGPRAAKVADERERGNAPSSLQAIAAMVSETITIGGAVARITAPRSGRGARTISEKEACAAVLVARDIGWIAFGEARN
ncbi:MAG: serine/threonine protein kinase [Polyangiaceae bacterium]|nr:serine/threonine protein kinase [Polyangiaceae bacterium]